MKIKRVTRRSVMLLAVLALPLAGCVHVQPWERGVLAKPHMALEATPMQNTIRSHTYESREAAASINRAGGGGGCGCY
jgi:hypothetical protein